MKKAFPFIGLLTAIVLLGGCASSTPEELGGSMSSELKNKFEVATTSTVGEFLVCDSDGCSVGKANDYIDDIYGENGVFTDLTATNATTNNITIGTMVSSTNFEAGDGAVGSPAYTFAADTNTGIYRVGSDSVGLALGGAAALLLDGTHTRSLPGTLALPGYAFTNDSNVGMYRKDADILGFGVNGAVFEMGTTYVSSSVAFLPDLNDSLDIGIYGTAWQDIFASGTVLQAQHKYTQEQTQIRQ